MAETVDRWTWCKLTILVTAVAVACGGGADSDRGGGSQPVSSPPATAGPALTIGSVSLELTKEDQVYRRFADWLTAQLGEPWPREARVVVTDSLGAMAEELTAGRVDLYLDSPFPVVWMARQTGVRPFLRRWKKGVPSYSSVVFTRIDSGVTGLGGLQGRVLAFGEPFSTSSFLMPKATLMAQGYRLERYEDPAAEVPSDRIGYLFSMDAENTMAWVLHGRIAAGAVNADYFVEMAGDRRRELRVLLETEEVPRHIVCHRADLDPALVRRVESVLLEAHRDPAGQEMLRSFERTARFDRFPVEPERALAPIGQLLEFVETDIGR